MEDLESTAFRVWGHEHPPPLLAIDKVNLFEGIYFQVRCIAWLRPAPSRTQTVHAANLSSAVVLLQSRALDECSVLVLQSLAGAYRPETLNRKPFVRVSIFMGRLLTAGVQRLGQVDDLGFKFRWRRLPKPTSLALGTPPPEA